jgi:hypothetical protein
MPVHELVARQIAIVHAAGILARALSGTPMHLRRDDAAGDWQPRRGDRVVIRDGHGWPGLPAGSFTISEVVGHGPNAMATLTNAAGGVFKWFRRAELQLEEQMATIEHALKMTTGTGQAVKSLNADAVKSYLEEHNIAGCNDPVEEAEPQYMLDGKIISLSMLPALKKCVTFTEAVRVFRAETGADARAGYLGAATLRQDLAEAR